MDVELAHLRSNLEGLEIRDTLLREFPALLDEVVPDPANFRRGKGLHPIDTATAERNLRVSPLAFTLSRPRWSRGLQVHVLQMH